MGVSFWNSMIPRSVGIKTADSGSSSHSKLSSGGSGGSGMPVSAKKMQLFFAQNGHSEACRRAQTVRFRLFGLALSGQGSQHLWIIKSIGLHMSNRHLPTYICYGFLIVYNNHNSFITDQRRTHSRPFFL